MTHRHRTAQPAPARHRRARPGGDRPDSRHGARDEGGRHAPDQEGPDAARPDHHQPVLRAEHADAHVVRARREAAQRRHARMTTSRIERRQGRDARRHGADPRGHVAGHDRDAARRLGRAASARAHLPRQHHQRRRRHARASDAGAARRVHDPIERKGRLAGLRVAIVGDLAHSRVLRSNVLLLTRMGAECAPAGRRRSCRRARPAGRAASRRRSTRRWTVPTS